MVIWKKFCFGHTALCIFQTKLFNELKLTKLQKESLQSAIDLYDEITHNRGFDGEA